MVTCFLLLTPCFCFWILRVAVGFCFLFYFLVFLYLFVHYLPELCTCTQLLLVHHSFFVFCCWRRLVFRYKRWSKGSQIPGPSRLTPSRPWVPYLPLKVSPDPVPLSVSPGASSVPPSLLYSRPPGAYFSFFLSPAALHWSAFVSLEFYRKGGSWVWLQRPRVLCSRSVINRNIKILTRFTKHTIRTMKKIISHNIKIRA